MLRLVLFLAAAAAAGGSAHGPARSMQQAQGKIAVYYAGWQLVAKRPDQPSAGDVRNSTRISALVQRGFTHVMMDDGNLEVNHAVEPLDTLRSLAERGLASYMNVGWSQHAFYMAPPHQPVALRRQLSPFVNRTRYRLKVQQIENIMRAASPWLAGVAVGETVILLTLPRHVY